MKNKKFNVIFIYILILTQSILLAACGGGSEDDAAQLSEIIVFIEDGFKTPLVDQTFQLSAVGITGAGTNEELTTKVKWVSDKPKIAAISTDGKVTTKTEGNAVITASYSGLSGSKKISISLPPRVESLNILENEGGYIVSEGSSLFLIAKGTLSNEETVQDNSFYEWTSSDDKIATVDNEGRVIAITPGETVIKVAAKDNADVNAEISVTIKAKVIGIAPDSGVTYIEIGEKAKFIVNEALSDESFNPIPTLVKWFYDTPDVMRITATGKVNTSNIGIVNATAVYKDFELTHKFIVENPIELFVIEDTGGFIKLAWHAKNNVNSYTLFWNNGGKDEEDKVVQIDDPETLEFTHSDIDPSKPYFYRLAFTRNEELSTPSTEMKVWTHIGKWQFRDVIGPRLFAAGASVAENMYLMGGELTVPSDPSKPTLDTKQVITGEVWEYNMIKNKWTRESSLETPIKNATACAFNELIYLIGGENKNSTIVKTVSAYNTRLNKWTFDLPTLPIALKQVSCNALNEFLYVTGGHDGTNAVATTYAYDINKAEWIPLPSLNTARFGHASQVLNDKIYIAGGSTAVDAATGEMEVLDPTAETRVWTSIDAVGTPRAAFAMYSWNDKLHAMGGIDNNQTLIDEVTSYDPIEKNWTVNSTMTFASDAFNSTLYNESVYFWGGSIQAREASNGQSNFMKYSINNGNWVHDTTTSAARTEFNSVMIDDKLYLIGGGNSLSPSTDFRVYDTKNNSWNKLNSLLTPRQRASAVALDNGTTQKIYVLGGINSGNNLEQVEVYDIKQKTWESKANMDAGRSYAAVALFDLKIYVFGSDNSVARKTFEIYDIKRNTWQAQGSLPRNRSHASAVTLNSKIYLIGGIVDGDATDIVDIYDPLSGNWTVGGTLKVARSKSGSTVLNGRIYVFGGLDTGNDPVKSSEVYTPFNKEWSLLPNLPNFSRGARGGSYENKIYLISEEGNPPSNIINNIYVLE